MTNNRNEKEKELQVDEIFNAKLYMDSNLNASMSMNVLHGKSGDMRTLMDKMKESFNRVKTGNLEEMDEILISQIKMLDALFYLGVRNISKNSTHKGIDLMTNVALRAQSNCRKTIATLAAIKNPKSPTVIKQQNNAINQQVNNSDVIAKKSANELLSEVEHEKLDDRSTQTSIAINPAVETMEAIDRR